MLGGNRGVLSVRASRCSLPKAERPLRLGGKGGRPLCNLNWLNSPIMAKTSQTIDNTISEKKLSHFNCINLTHQN